MPVFLFHWWYMECTIVSGWRLIGGRETYFPKPMIRQDLGGTAVTLNVTVEHV